MRTAATRLALLALLAAVAAFAPAQGGDEATKLFEAMDEHLAKAKSVRLDFSIGVEVDGKKVGAMKGSLAFATANQVRFASEGMARGKGDEDKVTLTADGKHMRYTWMAGPKVIKDRTVPTPKNLSAEFAWMLSRPGLSFGFDSLEISTVRPKERNRGELFPISDLKLGGTEKIEGREARVLSYKVKNYRGKTLNVTLWVDSLTRLPLKRVGAMREGGRKVRWTELYTGLKIDAKLDPKQFALPK